MRYISIIRTVIALFAIFLLTYNLSAQVYHLPNGNFESWSNNIPTGWNTFNSATGTYASFASSNHHSQETGHSGNYCVKIYSTSILGVVANGNMTTGRINAGAMSAASSSNYNFSDRSNSYAQVFNGTPDSMYVWTKMTAASASTQATVRAYIHGNTNFIDPNDCSTPSLYKGKAAVIFTPHSTWTQQKTAFVYDGSSSVNYILITMTTNITPGSGAANDAIYVDDLEFIYSAWLTDIKANGVTLPGFQKDVFDYYVEYPRGTNPATALPTITYTKEVSDANVVVTTNYTTQGSIDGATRIITSTAEDGTTKKIYRIHYNIAKSSDKDLSSFAWVLGNDTTVVATGTASDIYISLPAGTTTAPSVINCITADTGARSTVNQAVSPNGNAVICVTAEDGTTKNYTIHFSVTLSDNADLASLSYNGIPVPNFHADTLNYYITLPSGTQLVPYVSATTAWQGLNPSITSAAALPGTTVVTVTAEDGITTKTYYLHFTVAISVNADLSWIRYNNISVKNFHADTCNYTVELPYGSTQAIVTAAAAESTSSVQITQAAQIPGTAVIYVTAEDTSVHKTYTVNFVIGRNNNANLSSLSYILGNDTFSIGNFNNLITTYRIALPEGTVIAPVVIAAAEDSNATVQITQALSANDSAVVFVTAENQSTVLNFTLYFTVTLSTNANLDSLWINDIPLAEFSPLTYTYNIALDTLLMPKAEAHCAHAKAQYSIVYPQSIPGQIQIIVTAEDTTVKKIYKINLTISASNNPNLVDLGYTINGNDYYLPNFHPDTTIYYVTLPSQTIDIPTIIYQVADMGASVKVTQPSSPNGVGIVMVMAADSVTFKIYQVYFHVEISSNADLATLSYNGNPILAFHPDTLHYYITLPYTAVRADSVSATAYSDAASVYIQQAQSYNDSAMVMVVAEDNISQKTYTIHFNRELSPIATLSSLGYTLNYADSAVSAFQSDWYDYTVIIAEEETHIPILYYQLSDNRSRAYMLRTPVTVNDTAKIVVVAENGMDSNIYTIAFYYTPSSNTYLDSIIINGVALASFNKDTLSYNVILPWGTAIFPVVNAHAEFNAAQVQITAAATIFGTTQIRVVAENGINQRIYNIHFQEGSNADLASLSYTLGNLTDSVTDFSSQDSLFYVMLPIGNQLVPSLNYTLVDARSTVTVKNAASANDTAVITVTGWDNLSLRHYYVIFKVELSTEARLTDLMIDNVTLAGFHPDTLHYAVEYPYGYQQLPVISAVASQPDAAIVYQQITQYPGDALVTVYAGDTTISTTYSIHFSVEAGDNNYLDTIICSDYPIADFDKYINHYHITLEYGSTQVPEISAIAEDSRSQVNILPANTINDTTFIEVIAVNSDTNIYSISFSVALCPDATLASITIDGHPLEKFSSSTRNYKYPVSPSFMGIPSVTAVTTDNDATYIVIDADSIPGQTRIEVTAADGINTMTYRINFYISETENINERADADIVLFPNPAQEIINIQINNNLINTCFMLYNMQGELIIKRTLTDINNVIDIGYLPKASYYYQLIHRQRIVKAGKVIKN